MGSYEPGMGSAVEGAEFTIRSVPCPGRMRVACGPLSRQEEGGKALHPGGVGLMRGTEVARRGMPWRLFTLSKRSSHYAIWPAHDAGRLTTGEPNAQAEDQER